jgi:hypothetical protein
MASEYIFALSKMAVTYPGAAQFSASNVGARGYCSDIGSALSLNGGSWLAGEDGQRPRRDEGDLIAHKYSLQALHDTQSDHTKRLTRIEDKVGSIEDKVGSIEDKVGSIEQGLGDVRIGVHAILDLLDAHLARKPRWRARHAC